MKRRTSVARLAGHISFTAAVLAFAAGASAQVTPAEGSVPPDDKPSVKIGGTTFIDYTYTESPKGKDANGNEINPNSFNITRAYINVTGQVHHLVSFRITPDITRDTDAAGSLAGSLVVRLKYGFAQFNMDEWTTKGTWIRLGLQQTPYIDYAEGTYRYRFQGAIEVDRDGFLTSSDLGVSGHYNFPGNYGDVHIGGYNGEGYSKAEANDQKGFQVRASFRPFPSMQVAKGWRITGFANADHVAHDQKRNRWLADTTFEYQYVNAGFSYIWGENQAAPGAPTVTATGLSAWVNPRTPFGLEALVRYDEYKANRDLDPKKKRVIAGIAWWFNFGHGITAALMADYDDETFSNYSPSVPNNRKYALHTLLNF